MCFRIIAIVIFHILSISYSSSQALNYSFFTAGHSYGNPIKYHYGLHYPFVDYFPKINSNQEIQFGILTGDVVAEKTKSYWDSTQKDINKLNIPVYIAAGNHDISDEFVSRYGDYYYKFLHKNDLFIILTPGLSSWNISGDQLEFFKNTLDSNYSTVKNVFIFMHELIWWSPNNEYKNVFINYAKHYPGSNNYESTIKPLLLSYPNNFVLYAGDLGATWESSPYMYDKFENITLIGSGMGGEEKDNIIITNVFEDSIYFDLVALNGDDSKKLGELNNFSIYASSDISKENNVIISHNPGSNSINLTNKTSINIIYYLHNINGGLVQKNKVFAFAESNIDTTGLISGVYVLKLRGDQKILVKKIIVL